MGQLWRRTPYRASDWFGQRLLDEARAYAKPRHRIKFASSVLGFAALVVFIAVGAGPWIADAVGGPWPVQLVAVVGALLAMATLVDLPFEAYIQLVYDKRFGLSTVTAGRFAVDQVKDLVIQSALTSVLLLPVYAAIRWTDMWWLYGWAAFMAVQVVVVFVYPVLIMPRFNKFTPLPDGELRSRIEAVAAKADTKIEGVYTMDASMRTSRSNAFVAGFGPSKRVVLFDTIVDDPPELVEQIVAHEIGHYRLKHIPKSFPFLGFVFLAAFVFIRMVTAWDPLLELAGVDSLGDPAGVPLFILTFGAAFFGLQMVIAWFTRFKEREADFDCLELLRDPRAFIEVWRTLAPKDKVELEPSWWTKLNHSHPEVPERMAFAKAWADANGVPLEVPEPLESVGS